MGWTDRHCRFFHRLVTKNALLYTEMVTTGALLHGDLSHHLRFNLEENPIALQLGGSEPAELAKCAKLAQQWGYDTVNLNCGCPSERVQKGAFGACLMLEPDLVADCVKAMQDAVDIPVTVKHRIGIDQMESYEFVRDFVGRLDQAGCNTFIVHARSAWLKGLNPKQNREVPPLRYGRVYQLKRDFPDCSIILNGGIQSNDEIAHHLLHVDGVMVGREAYRNPWMMHRWDKDFLGGIPNAVTRQDIHMFMLGYLGRVMQDEAKRCEMVGRSQNSIRHSVMRHTFGLYHGEKNARVWRRYVNQSCPEIKNLQDVLKVFN